MPDSKAGGLSSVLSGRDVFAGTCGTQARSDPAAVRAEIALALSCRVLVELSGTVIASPVVLLWLYAQTSKHVAGGVVVTLVGHPFDTLKVRLQTQSSTKPIYCTPQPHGKTYLVSSLHQQYLHAVEASSSLY